MKNYLKKTKTYLISHKKISLIILITILILGYWGYKKTTNVNAETQYVTTTVQKGTIISSITASGQVEASNQIDIKSDVTGQIVYVAVKPGDKVVRGKTLFSIDNKDAKKSVRDAEINLESAKISLEKLKIEKSKENMDADLTKSYDDGFNNVSNAFLDLPSIMTGLENMFFKSNINPTTAQWNIDWYEGQVSSEDMEKTKLYKNIFADSYNIALKSYNDSMDRYKSVSRVSDSATIEALISQTYETMKLLSDAIKNANNYIDFVNSSIQKRDSNPTTPTIINTHKTSLNDYTSKTNSHLLSLLSIKTSIKGYKDAFFNADLDIQASELSVKQKENTLQDAKDKLSDYYIVAPFDGIIASVTGKIGDTSSSSLGSIITNQKIATLSMNEVDVSKIRLGQKATVTFDAVENLTTTGSVVEIDTVGAVSQGVVSYNVKIAFDTENDQIKPGMSVSASIITDSKTDILIAPLSAIKSQGETRYVQMFEIPLANPVQGSQGTTSETTPIQTKVEVGISDDTNIEIISGLKEGDQIVSRIITNTTNKTTTTKSATSLLSGGRGPGM